MPLFPSTATSLGGAPAALPALVQQLSLLASARLAALGIDADHKAYLPSGVPLPAAPFAVVLDGVAYTAVAARAGLPPRQLGFAYLKRT